MLLGSVPLGVVNEANLVQSLNIEEASVILSGSSTPHEVNPGQLENIEEVFVILSGSVPFHEVNPVQP